MRKSNILITGGAGFIGINFIQYLLSVDKEAYNIINLDKMTYVSNKDANSIFKKHKNYSFVKIDICNKKKINSFFSNNKIDIVINFAAESHVDNSISNPINFLQTNVIGTYNLLFAAYEKWMKKPFEYYNNYKNSFFLQISTDEVYGSLKNKYFANENFRFNPSSPYSASKASGDHFVSSFNKTFGLKTIITNCTNNYGPFQNNEKLIPKIICNALNEKPIDIYGDGTNIRDWLFVKDHCSAIRKIIKYGKSGNNYNIAANEEKNNNYIARKICSLLDKKKPRTKGSYSTLIRYVKDRYGHDFRYGVNFSKIKKELNWKPITDLNKGLELTVDWYLNKYNSN